MRKVLIAGLIFGAISAGLLAQVVTLPQQSRDSQAQAQAPATAVIMGTVVVGGSGQPADGVRLTLSANELRGSRTALTDDSGNFAFLALPAGTYTLRATKTGHVSASYGQRQPGRPGTPIVLAVGQQLKGISLEVPKGGVIAGTIYDEKNRPAVSVSVRVLQWTMQSGERVLNSAGAGTTDDRGMYRVFGLVPGDYVVNAVPRNTSATTLSAADLQSLERMQELSRLGLASVADMANVSREVGASTDAVSGYAAVYYPGTPLLGNAQSVKVDVSQEQLGIDFQLQRVPLSKITGTVMAPAGIAVQNIQLRLVDSSSLTPGQVQFSARATPQGAFSFAAVPPGQYQLSATVQVPVTPVKVQGLIEQQPPSGGPRLWALADVLVDGSYVPNVTLSLQEGMTLRGSVSFDGVAPQPPQLDKVRLMLSPHGQAMSMSGASAMNVNADASGRFAFSGVTPGQYRIRALGVSGWTLKSVMVDGRDALDFWVDVKPATNISNIVAEFGDTSSTLTGTLQGPAGQPTADYTVILFASDSRYWVPLTRRVRSARPATDGRFSFTGLPPGDYRLAAVTDVEPGAWYDPALLQQLHPVSVAVRLTDGQPVVQDLRVSGGS